MNLLSALYQSFSLLCHCIEVCPFWSSLPKSFSGIAIGTNENDSGSRTLLAGWADWPTNYCTYHGYSTAIAGPFYASC